MIKEFTVGASHTINLGNYESTKIEASVTVAVAEGVADNEYEWSLTKANAQKELRTLLEETFRNQSRKGSKAGDK